MSGIPIPEQLVGYIHLNPLRARIVADLKELSNFCLCLTFLFTYVIFLT
jgi:hypothetical protein